MLSALRAARTWKLPKLTRSIPIVTCRGRKVNYGADFKIEDVIDTMAAVAAISKPSNLPECYMGVLSA